jgi:hypothetical protein
MVGQLRARPRDPALLRRIDSTVALARSAPFQVDLRQAQNGCYDLLQTVYPERLDQAEKGDAAAIEWVALFRQVGEGLQVRVE